MCNPNEDLRNQLNKINLYIDAAKNLNDTVPFLHEARQQTEWALKIYESSLGSSGEIPYCFHETVKFWADIPDPPVFNTSIATSAIGIASADCGDASGVLYNIAHADSSINSDTAKSLYNEYHCSVEDTSRINRIIAIMNNLSASVTAEFIESTEVKARFQENLSLSSDLALKMRNTLEHFFGELNKLRSPVQKNGKVIIPEMSWPKLVKEVAKKGNDSHLLRQQKKYELLHSILSEIMKKIKQVNMDEMVRYYDDYISLIDTVLNLVDVSLFRNGLNSPTS